MTEHIVRFDPWLRAFDIERDERAPYQPDTYYLVKAYDAERLTNIPERYRPATVRALLNALWRREVRVLEVPEPLYLRYAPHALALSVAAKGIGVLRRRRTAVVTYVIENASPRQVFGALPVRGPDVLFTALRAAALAPWKPVLDAMAFGSPAARAAHGPQHRTLIRRASVFHDLPQRPSDASQPDKGQHHLVFVGGFEPRKGIPRLLSTYAALRRCDERYTLTIVGKGAMQAEVEAFAASHEGVEVLIDPPRERIAAELARARFLVLLSRDTPSWREQIGLPIVEGLAAGCQVVTTDRTGLADWLAAREHIVVDEATSGREIAQRIIGAAGQPFAVRDLPSVDGRIAAQSWLYETAVRGASTSE